MALKQKGEQQRHQGQTQQPFFDAAQNSNGAASKEAVRK